MDVVDTNSFDIFPRRREPFFFADAGIRAINSANITARPCNRTPVRKM
jgi:hypothetical protein